MKTNFTTILGTFLIFTAIVSAQPTWLQKSNLEQGFYYGVGGASKKENPTDYTSIAKNKALSDLSSEISVELISTSSLSTEEDSTIRSNFQKLTKTFTKQALEGYESVDRWEDANEYWVLYKLSKAEYAKAKALKYQKAVDGCTHYLDESDKYLQASDYNLAISNTCKALEAMLPYFNSDQMVERSGQKVALFPYAKQKLQDIFSDIKMDATVPSETIKLFKELKVKIPIIFSSNSADKTSQKFTNIPLINSFARGIGKISNNLNVSAGNKATLSLSKITSQSVTNIITSKIDWKKYFSTDSNFVLVSMLSTDVAPTSIDIRIDATPLSIKLICDEQNLSKTTGQQIIAGLLKNEFTKKGIQFSEKDPDVIINVIATTRQGTQLYGQFVSFCDYKVSVLNPLGDEVYGDSKTNIKGIQTDYEKAGLKALESAANSISASLVDKIIEVLSK